jgi:hypothetical protein
MARPGIVADSGRLANGEWQKVIRKNGPGVMASDIDQDSVSICP